MKNERRTVLLREWMVRHASSLDLSRRSIRSPRPDVVVGVTGDGELVTFEIRVYPQGQW